MCIRDSLVCGMATCATDACRSQKLLIWVPPKRRKRWADREKTTYMTSWSKEACNIVIGTTGANGVEGTKDDGSFRTVLLKIPYKD